VSKCSRFFPRKTDVCVCLLLNTLANECPTLHDTLRIPVQVVHLLPGRRDRDKNVPLTTTHYSVGCARSWRDEMALSLSSASGDQRQRLTAHRRDCCNSDPVSASHDKTVCTCWCVTSRVKPPMKRNLTIMSAVAAEAPTVQEALSGKRPRRLLSILCISLLEFSSMYA
jgi:hypothetical protein